MKILTDKECKKIYNSGKPFKVDSEEGKQVMAWLKRTTNTSIKKNHNWKSGLN